MGVLTKPDLATEEASKDTIRDLVLGKGSNLKLGYHVVKNRSTLDQRFASEEAFFMDHAWSAITDHCGITSLKQRLRGLLMNISKQEIPHVKSDIDQRLHACKGKLDAMGPARLGEQSQRQYLGKLVDRFQEVTRSALSGYYASDKLFKTDPGLKLVSRKMKLNEDFSNNFKERGHKFGFGPKWVDNEDQEGSFASKMGSLPIEIPLTKYPEILDILQADDYECPPSSESPIMEQIEDVYASSRGPELGTVETRFTNESHHC